MIPKLKLKSTNEYGNITIVTLQNKYGQYSGMSICKDEDLDKKSHIIGGNYAECKAQIAYIQERLKTIKLQLQTVLNLKKDFIYSNLEVPRPVKLKIRDYSQQVEDLTNYLQYLKQYIPNAEKQRDKLRKKD